MQMFATARAILEELAIVLANLANEYNNVIRLAGRWPGTRPADMSIQDLQTSYNTVLNLLNQIQFTKNLVVVIQTNRLVVYSQSID